MPAGRSHLENPEYRERIGERRRMEKEEGGGG